jgi:hypothetical protein
MILNRRQIRAFSFGNSRREAFASEHFVWGSFTGGAESRG